MSMADLIATQRKEKGMTQKQLADILGVTDKAVSKWERGNGQPDIQFLEPLADALGVTVIELLRGEIKQAEGISPNENTEDEKIVKKTLTYASDVYKARSQKTPYIISLCILFVGLIGVVTTTIVDFALNKGLTWSLFPISSIVFLWLCILPLFFFKKHKVNMALLSTSIFLVPFLYILCRLTGGNWFGSIAMPVLLASLTMVWLIRFVFATKLTGWNKWALSMLIMAAGEIAINLILSRVLAGGGLDIGDAMSAAILVVTAAILFIIGSVRKPADA